MRYNKIDRSLSILKVNLILERFRNLILSQDYLLKNKLHTNTGIIKFSDYKNSDYEKQLINKIVASDQEIKLIKDVLIAVDKLPYKQRYIITEVYIRNKDIEKLKKQINGFTKCYHDALFSLAVNLDIVEYIEWWNFDRYFVLFLSYIDSEISNICDNISIDEK